MTMKPIVVVVVAFAIVSPVNALPKWSWDTVSTWCFPCFATLPLTAQQINWYSKFDMVDQCCSGLTMNSSGGYVGNVMEQSLKFGETLKSDKSSTFFSPYIGMEMGQNWYAAQAEWNSNAQYASQWLKYKNGTVMTCDEEHRDLCALLQRGQNNSKVYDWRAPGMIEYFIQNISGPYFDSAEVDGVFYDDIYTVCEWVASSGVVSGWFDKDAADDFCNSAFEALNATAIAARASGTLPIFSLKGDETNATAYNLTKYKDIVVQQGAMAYFEYWMGWINQPRNEDLLNFAIELGQLNVPMQMHASPINDYCGGANYKNYTDWPLATFLIAAGEQSYFSVGSGWNAGLDQSFWLADYDKPLGPPKGPATMVAPHVYTRDFEHVSVWVNLTDCNATKLIWS